MEIKLAGERLLLSEEKIIYWRKRNSIFIADFHLGKTTHFRKSGIAIPTGIVNAELDRLKNIISRFQPEKIYFLGDLFHSELNNEWRLFNDFLQQYPDIEFILIKGNHDILSDTSYNLSRLKVKKEPYLLAPFLLSHHPLEMEGVDKGQINFCGHVHPGISVTGKGRTHLSLPCYYLLTYQIILPAFGRFTGLAKIKPVKESQVFLVLNDSVKKWS